MSICISSKLVCTVTEPLRNLFHTETAVKHKRCIAVSKVMYANFRQIVLAEQVLKGVQYIIIVKRYTLSVHAHIIPCLAQWSLSAIKLMQVVKLFITKRKLTA